jgi:hypothetical protein
MKRKTKIFFQLLLCLVVPVLVGCPERDNVAGDYVGEWWNDDRDTDYITRIIITPYEDDQDLDVQGITFLWVQVFSACDPDDCDWGPDTGWFLANIPYELQSDYEFAFEEVYVDMVLDRSTRVLTVREYHNLGYEELNYEIVHSFHEYG